MNLVFMEIQFDGRADIHQVITQITVELELW